MPNTHFFLCEYREMTDAMPDPQKFSTRLAALHQNSKSPNGKFGFHMTTYSGNLPQVTEWEDSWEVYFAKSMKLALDLEIKAKGPDPELDTLVPTLFKKIIPRLLHPLESEGRSVKPSLVHGDLWYANSGTDVDTGEPLVFDACCFYAHNECRHAQDIRLTLPCFLKMSLVNGCQSATDSGPSIWQHIILRFRSRPQKRTIAAA